MREKVAIVTGSSRGIGKAIALAFANEGAKVIVASRTGAKRDSASNDIYSVAEEITAFGGRALPIRTDVTNWESVQSMVDCTLTEFADIDILVNNAAVFPDFHTRLVDFPLDSWDITMNVNIRGVFYCTKAVLPHMISRKKGNIINISSIGAVRAGPGRICYGASKAAVERITFGLADEVREYNISVNALCPIGVTNTASGRELFPNDDPNRFVKPEDVARAAVWLANQGAQSFTGRAITVPASGHSTVFIYGRGIAEKMWVMVE